MMHGQQNVKLHLKCFVCSWNVQTL